MIDAIQHLLRVSDERVNINRRNRRLTDVVSNMSNIAINAQFAFTDLNLALHSVFPMKIWDWSTKNNQNRLLLICRI